MSAIRKHAGRGFELVRTAYGARVLDSGLSIRTTFVRPEGMNVVCGRRHTAAGSSAASYSPRANCGTEVDSHSTAADPVATERLVRAWRTPGAETRFQRGPRQG